MISNFIFSVTIVLIAQIPLLMKLYLDSKGKRDVFKHQLFERQMDAYLKLYSCLDVLHRRLHGLVQMWDYDGGIDKESQKSLAEIQLLCVEQALKFSELITQNELLIPGRLVTMLCEYRGTAFKIYANAAKTGPISIKNWVELVPVWDEQTLRFNLLINGMRTHLGIDLLSNEHAKLVAANGKTEVIFSNYQVGRVVGY